MKDKNGKKIPIRFATAPPSIWHKDKKRYTRKTKHKKGLAMKEELELKLVEKYPRLYQQYGGDMTQTCMYWGFSCGDGWYDLIDELSEKLSKFDVVAEQVKEKFAGLRFYYSVNVNFTDRVINKIRVFFFRRGLAKQFYKIDNIRRKFYRTTDEKVSDIVYEYEERSYKICELCGKPGRVIGKMWVATRCGECEKK